MSEQSNLAALVRPIEAPAPLSTRVTELLGLRYPIVQAGMSWASSSAPLATAVSVAGGLGVIAAGPMAPESLRQAIAELRARTDAPFAVNVPLYNRRAPDLLAVALDERVPAIIGSQGGPGAHLARFHDAGIRWLHVCASPRHAEKAAQAGVDAVIAVGAEAGGHPPPDEVGTLVVVRAVCRSVDIPVIAGGGVADGAGMAALFCLGAEAVQFGTRFLLTPEASVHPAYKEASLAAGIADTTLVGRGHLPVRMLRNEFTRHYAEAERGQGIEQDLKALADSKTLRMAALDGDIAWGKVEVGQSVGLINELEPAGELVYRLMREFNEARERLARWR